MTDGGSGGSGVGVVVGGGVQGVRVRAGAAVGMRVGGWREGRVRVRRMTWSCRKRKRA